MSKTEKKKVVVTTTSSKPAPTVSRTSKSAGSVQSRKGELIFGRRNYMIMLLGIGLIALGLMLMSGGAMQSPEVWDESIIYSKRRTLVAPLVIIAGLVLEIIAIFRNPGVEEKQEISA